MEGASKVIVTNQEREELSRDGEASVMLEGGMTGDDSLGKEGCKSMRGRQAGESFGGRMEWKTRP